MADRFLRLPEVLDLIGVKKSTLYSWINGKSKYFRPDFPRRIFLSTNGKGPVVWSENELNSWMENCRNNFAGGDQ